MDLKIISKGMHKVLWKDFANRQTSQERSIGQMKMNWLCFGNEVVICCEFAYI